MLAQPGEQYAIYLRTPIGKQPNDSPVKSRFDDQELVLELQLSPGDFTVEWWDTKQGSIPKRERFSHAGGTRRLPGPAFEGDIALAVLRVR